LRRSTAAPLALLALAALTALAPLTAKRASADWLVTRAGTRVETRGAWQVKGKLVVFHTPAGTLSSLRLAEVDLDASGRATAQAEQTRQAAETAAAKEPEKKRPVLVLTDDKVRHVEAGGSAPAPASPGAPAAVTAMTGPRLTVESWDRSPDSANGGVVLIGTLQNSSKVSATDITLSVQLLDDTGQPTATGQAVLTSTALEPGQQSGFRVSFPEVTAYSDVKFDPKGTGAPAKPEPSSSKEPAQEKENP
jgi:hypothetical protein